MEVSDRLAVNQKVRLKAVIAPAPLTEPVRYAWSVSEGGRITEPNTGAEVLVQRAETGECVVTVEAQDGNGCKLGTGVAKFTCCHPDPVSPVKVALANFVPVLVHRLPTCVPVLAAAL